MPFTPNTSPTFTYQPKHGVAQILPATTTSQLTLVTASGNGAKVLALYASSTDSSLAHNVVLNLVRGGVSYLLWTTSVPISAGNIAGTPAVDLMDAVNHTNVPAGMLAWDHDGRPYINMETGDTLAVNVTVTVTAAMVVNVHADFENF